MILKHILMSITLVFLIKDVSCQSVLATKFDLEHMQFRGSRVEQASYLLRPVGKYAKIGDQLTVLPSFLDSLMTGSCTIPPIQLFKNYLVEVAMDDRSIGGSLDDDLVDVEGFFANYFVIHDASNLIKNAKKFPLEVNLSSWKGNDLSRVAGFKNAHLFINRLGVSVTVNDFNKKITGTKFEMSSQNPGIGKKCVGDFLHIELIQPRMSDDFLKNDAIAINPGFTDQQYKTLATIYIAASIRRGGWMIPAFHSVLDEGIKDAHDDPQNFDLEKFVTQIQNIYSLISTGQ